jgi:hypothetical protein
MTVLAHVSKSYFEKREGNCCHAAVLSPHQTESRWTTTTTMPTTKPVDGEAVNT